jgi:rhamnosyltransferase
MAIIKAQQRNLRTPNAADTVQSSVRIIIPTLNAGTQWGQLIAAIQGNMPPQQVLIVDSSSTDATVELARKAGFEVEVRPRSEFNHGATRQLAAAMSEDYELLIFMTQDAMLAGEADIGKLIAAFKDSDIGAAYGRQLPHKEAGPLEVHARLFNYPEKSAVRTLSSKEQLGFKAIFISNSFAAYRRVALQGVGGFPVDTIFGEDTITAARLLKAGWKIAYVAEAQVYHSHSYTWRQEFRRYFDIGVLHQRESWLLEEFGGAGGEGARFVRSELRYLWPAHWWLIPSALIRTALKLAGYRLGRLEKHLPTELKRRFSMNGGYWK